MGTAVTMDVQNPGPSGLTPPGKPSAELEAKSWAEHLNRFPEACKKQTSDVELEEARRRGCYRVLPPVGASEDQDQTMGELLQEIDAEVRKALIF